MKKIKVTDIIGVRVRYYDYHGWGLIVGESEEGAVQIEFRLNPTIIRKGTIKLICDSEGGLSRKRRDQLRIESGEWISDAINEKLKREEE